MARRQWLVLVAVSTVLAGSVEGSEERAQAPPSQQVALLAKVRVEAPPADQAAPVVTLDATTGTAAPADDSTKATPAVTPCSGQSVAGLVECLHYDGPGFQIGVTIVAAVAGISMLISGEFVFRYLVVILSFVAATLCTRYQLSPALSGARAIWQGASIIWCTAAGVEAGVVFAIIIWKGYEGVKILLGAAFGAWAMWRIDTFFVHANDGDMRHVPALAVIMYTLFVVLGILMFTLLHRHFLAVIAPALGGLLIASSMGVSTAAGLQLLQKSGNLPTLKPDGSKWINFFDYLLGQTQQSVGIFGDSHISIGSLTIRYDTILGYVFWIILWILGLYIHIRIEKNKKKGKYAGSTANTSLVQPLNSNP